MEYNTLKKSENTEMCLTWWEASLRIIDHLLNVLTCSDIKAQDQDQQAAADVHPHDSRLTEHLNTRALTCHPVLFRAENRNCCEMENQRSHFFVFCGFFVVNGHCGFLLYKHHSMKPLCPVVRRKEKLSNLLILRFRMKTKNKTTFWGNKVSAAWGAKHTDNYITLSWWW